ncbi:MAG: glycine--tRNA ligase subunit beta [Caulobacterales bacterium 32-69-10]|nr:MAG: glycine--tRNA ligase subunit beta [Caulobacterales bacterium 32-69-10]
MPQLLLEIFSEEIPARMQGQAARDLERMARERLTEAALGFDSLCAYAGPRRLTLVVDGLPVAQEDRVEERKGPRANAPEQALAGFLRSTGLTREQLIERDGVLFAEIARKGRPTPEIVAEMVEAIVRGFPWPKSMRWASGTLRWVRPLKRILCVFDGQVVPIAFEGLEAGALTEGHRFMGTDHAPIEAHSFDAYKQGLAGHFVVLDVAERKQRIIDGARAACAAKGLDLVEDEGLLEEVAGLSEWPTPILGDMDPAFLDLPPEVIRTSMRTHQKYFAVRDPATGRLAPHFLVVANIEAADGGALIAAGNAKVLSARLSDARFFWDEDRKIPLEDRLEKLSGVTFHAKLGTMAERVERIVALAREIAPLVGADPHLAATAARLAKADLATGMVGEFPELQGIMGGYYARQEPFAGVKAGELLSAEPDGTEDPLSGTGTLGRTEGEGRWFHGLTHDQIDAVADAVRDHYKPLGPGDTVPMGPVSVAVSLADKLDTLVGFFAVDEKPTGSKDPYALRRAALGVIRTTLENQVRFGLTAELVKHALVTGDLPSGLLEFFADRLKVTLRDQGKRHDLVDAVFALGDDDLVRIVARVEALDAFLATEDGANLLAGFKRAANILRAEAKKNPDERYEGMFDLAKASVPEESALAIAVSKARDALADQVEAENFAGAMTTLAALRAPVDAFFDKVLVNDPDPAVRLNRLRLLSQMRDAAGRVADFSLVTG